MTLEAGTRLGAFEVLGPLGAGGMGEVYRARDPKLDREVAIKLLPEQLIADKARLARFQREAQLLASLNHPNIASIYELGETSGKPFLVLELVEGPTLADRIASGQIEVDEVLDIARQIAEALEEAHERGVVHRDLKPANVKLTETGKVKVLDFGLAKAFASEEGEPSASTSQSPTMSAQATQAGVIMGTAAYMSPEQARGKPVDKRADIWAYGVVLFEMLGGRRLFEGDTVSDTLAAVLRAPIETDSLGSASPDRRLVCLIERCLVRDPAMRLRDIGEARILLSNSETSGEVAERDSGAWRSRSAAVTPWAVAALSVIVASVAVLRAPSAETVTAPQPLRFKIDAFHVGAGGVAISPDGRRLAFRQAQGDFGGSLWVRSLDHFEAVEIPNTSTNVATYFWSGDSREIAFVRGLDVSAHDIEAGTTRLLLRGEAPFRGGSWSKQGVILLAMARSIYRAPAVGGAPELLLTPEEGETAWHARPSFLPDGERFLFTSEIEERGDTLPVIQVAELTAPRRKRLLIKGA